MSEKPQHLLLRIFLGDHRPDDGPTCRTVVELLRDQGLAGATVLKGIAGYGSTSRIHTGSILRLSEGLPLVIEAIDEEPLIEAVLPVLVDLLPGALITTEQITVHSPGSGPG